jgi:outer membrane protein OmpA-like peptidoglycan-associated protein
MRVLAAVLVLSWCSAAVAQDENTVGKGEVRAISGAVLNLQGKIIDLGGAPIGLQVKETKTEIRLELAADVLFDFDKADLRPEAQATLKEAADFIRKHGGKGTVTIEGHTDGKGSDSYNQKLSERRAQSVRDYFTKTEKLSGQFAAKGFGKTKPVAPNAKPDGSDDPEGRQKNRRVEIVVRKS